MSRWIEVTSVNVSEEKGEVKRPVQGITIGEEGVVGDAHAGPWHRQVSLLSHDSIEAFAARANLSIGPGDFAENITLRGVDLAGAQLLDRFRLGSVELEVTQRGKKCHGEGCAIYRQVGSCIMPTEGLFCRVISGGTVRPGDVGEYLPRILRCHVITLSDRAFRGEYADRSGPRIRALLAEHLDAARRPHDIQSTLLPDDPERLRVELVAAHRAEADVIITTGGTGVGPRDHTPEVVAAFCDRLIPGIMEMIRVKFGAENPNALLSRSIAGIAGTCLVYALPGSAKAVEEYMGEILKTLEHLLLMAHGLDAHQAM